MRYVAWPCPGGDETALLIGGDDPRLLILPPLFDEANKLRRQIVATQRELAERGVASVLPDLPGCNESLADHGLQTLAGWREAAAAAAAHFAVSHVLAWRSGGWLAPRSLPGWLIAPPRPPQVLRGLLRARSLAAKEAGREESMADLAARGQREGIECAGWMLGAELVRELDAGAFAPSPDQKVVEQAEIGGAGLWLRAEPGYDAAQAGILAALIAGEIAA